MTTAWDTEIAARTTWGEARGEGPDGIQAVASAIINRFRAGKWFSTHTLAGCCLLASQFSCWNTNDANLPLLLRTDENDILLALCRDAIQKALDGLPDDPVRGATHYYAGGISAPAWAANATFCGQVGHHLFFKDVA